MGQSVSVTRRRRSAGASSHRLLEDSRRADFVGIPPTTDAASPDDVVVRARSPPACPRGAPASTRTHLGNTPVAAARFSRCAYRLGVTEEFLSSVESLFHSQRGVADGGVSRAERRTPVLQNSSDSDLLGAARGCQRRVPEEGTGTPGGPPRARRWPPRADHDVIREMQPGWSAGCRRSRTSESSSRARGGARRQTGGSQLDGSGLQPEVRRRLVHSE